MTETKTEKKAAKKAESKEGEIKEILKEEARHEKVEAEEKVRHGKAEAGKDAKTMRPEARGEAKQVGKKGDVEKLIEELVKKGETQSMIGASLRDQYGIPSVGKVSGKKLGKLLQEKNLGHEVPEDLQSLIKKSVKLTKHMEKNRGDLTSRRAAQVNESKIRRLAKYYKRKGKLDRKWKFGADKAELLVK